MLNQTESKLNKINPHTEEYIHFYNHNGENTEYYLQMKEEFKQWNNIIEILKDEQRLNKTYRCEIDFHCYVMGDFEFKFLQPFSLPPSESYDEEFHGVEIEITKVHSLDDYEDCGETPESFKRIHKIGLGRMGYDVFWLSELKEVN